MTDEPSTRWEGIPVDELARIWDAPAVHAYLRVGSTNDVARSLAEQGAPAGTVAVAEEQFAGRGRIGREWSSASDLGLWISLITRPEPTITPGMLPLAAGLAVSEALDHFLPAGAVRLKWPNDVVIEGRKVAGILCEGSWEGGAPSFVVIGVGINILHSLTDFPAELRTTATSLRLARAESLDRLEVATVVIRAMNRRVSDAAASGPELLASLEARDVLRGRDVVVTEPATDGVLVRGIAAGIAANGALLIRDAAGTVQQVHSGTVRFAEPAGYL